MGMRGALIVFFLLLGLAGLAQSSKPVSPPEIPADSAANRPALALRHLARPVDFVGEDLHYAVRYGFIEAGKARLTVKAGPVYAGRPTWRVIGTGRSTGPLDWVFRVRDHYESHIDQKGGVPHRFIRQVREGGYRLERRIDFDPSRRTAATTQHGTTRHHVMPAFVQDVVSALFFARRLQLTQLEPGEVVDIPTLVDGRIHSLRARFTGPRHVEVKAGSFDGLAFTPVVQEGRIWKDADDLTVVVSADERHIPILIESDLVIGSIRLELVEDRSTSASEHATDIRP